ncbi:MAG: type IV secretion system protein [Rugosibacter sp.]
MAAVDFAAIGDLLTPLLTASTVYGDALVPLGRTCLALSLILAVLPAVYSWWAGNVAGATAKIVRAMLIAWLPLFLLASNNWLMSSGAIAHFFQSEVTQPLSAKGGAVGEGGDIIKNTISKIGNSIWGGDLTGAAKSEKSGWEKAKTFFSNPVEAIGGAMFNVMLDFLFRIILTGIALFLSVALLFALFSPLLMLQIGIIFGPILVCWLPFEPLSGLAKTWLKFMVTSGMSLAVGVLLALLAGTSIDNFITTISTLNADPDLPFTMTVAAKLGGFLSNAAVMIFIGVMLFRADSIAGALVGGASGGGGGVGAAIINRVSKGKGGGKDKPAAPPKK